MTATVRLCPLELWLDGVPLKNAIERETAPGLNSAAPVPAALVMLLVAGAGKYGART